MALTGTLLRIKYIPVGQAALWDKNPKEHDMGGMIRSILEHGFRDAPIFDATLGAIPAGNGRTAALRQIEEMYERGDPDEWGEYGYDEPFVPKGVGIDGDGAWCIPLQFGVDAPSVEAAEAFGVDHNNLTMMGGPYTTIDIGKMYDVEGYAGVLERLSEYGQMPISVDLDDLEVLRKWRDGHIPLSHKWMEEAIEGPEVIFEKSGRVGPYDLPGVYVGDCVKLMRRMPAECIDLTVTSPPYDNLRDYEGYEFNFNEIAKELYRITKPGGVVVWVVANETVDGSESLTAQRQALFFVDECGFNMHDVMIYSRWSIPLTHRRYEQEFEYMYVLSKGAPATFNPIMVKKPKPGDGHAKPYGRDKDGRVERGFLSERATRIKGNVWRYPVGSSASEDKIAFDHPAIFPEALARDHILSWSAKGQLVFDPMCGSGTVVKQAQVLERQWLGFDISEEYIERIVKPRLAEYTGVRSDGD